MAEVERPGAGCSPLATRLLSDRHGRHKVVVRRDALASFCTCAHSDCHCGEDQHSLDWAWDLCSAPTQPIDVTSGGREVMFHTNYSSGTSAIRGTKAMRDGQHYWEIKMTTSVFGTDMMVGVVTADARLGHMMHHFGSLLGSDAEGWGLSYHGLLQHKRRFCSFLPRDHISRGTLIGLHLDLWHGELSVYLNRRLKGVAFRGLRGKELYPAISSTAARSGMKLMTTRSPPTSLQYLCVIALRRHVDPRQPLDEALPMAPGLVSTLRQTMDWLLHPTVAPCPVCTATVGRVYCIMRDVDPSHPSPTGSRRQPAPTDAEQLRVLSPTSVADNALRARCLLKDQQSDSELSRHGEPPVISPSACEDGEEQRRRDQAGHDADDGRPGTEWTEILPCLYSPPPAVLSDERTPGVLELTPCYTWYESVGACCHPGKAASSERQEKAQAGKTKATEDDSCGAEAVDGRCLSCQRDSYTYKVRVLDTEDYTGRAPSASGSGGQSSGDCEACGKRIVLKNMEDSKLCAERCHNGREVPRGSKRPRHVGGYPRSETEPSVPLQGISGTGQVGSGLEADSSPASPLSS